MSLSLAMTESLASLRELSKFTAFVLTDKAASIALRLNCLLRSCFLKSNRKSPIRRLGIGALSCDQQVHTTDQGPLLRYDLPCFNCRKSAYRLIARNIVYLIFFRFVKVFNLKYKQKLVYLSIPDLLFGIVSVLLQDRNQLAPVNSVKGYSVDQHVLLNDEILVHD